jgi:L-seryl-tRNA(Ser) seleniumtransferase
MNTPPDPDRRASPADHRDAMIYDDLGVAPIINAAGTSTRLSGGMMHPEVTAAMAEAATACVEMHELQAAASRAIAAATGAEAGIVTAGAAAALTLAAAACLAGLDTAAMDRLPDTARNEVLVARSQRNMYDRALMVAGARLIEIGIPDRFSGAGVRDATAAEFAAAITPRTAAILWVAQPWSEPALTDLAKVAHAAGLPVIVDAAAQLPPAENLRRFVAEGADLVCVSGGKAIGGPQASGILAGRRDLVCAALLQMLDLDLPETQFTLPPEFLGNAAPPRLPRHGIGRGCKTGKEEIVGLLVALRRFLAEPESVRSARLRARLEAVRRIAGGEILDGPVPLLLFRPCDARAAEAALRARRIHVGQGRLREGLLVVNPLALAERDLAPLGQALREVLG